MFHTIHVSQFTSKPQTEPGLRVMGHWVSDFGGVGSLTGQCVRPDVWPSFEL